MFDGNAAQTRRLSAGPLSLLLTGSDLRSIRFGSTEIINRLYFALRDANWGTIPGLLTSYAVEADDERFVVTFRSEHREREIDFAWDGRIEGGPEGRLAYVVDGEARSSFKRNRIGLCVLHPLSAAGDPVEVTHPDGRVERASFPRLISPHQPFLDIARFRHTLAGGDVADIRFSGELFETEDQRNWTDASFKTYCTPLRLPYPVEVHTGERVRQSIELVLERTARALAADRSGGAFRARRDEPAEAPAPVILSLAAARPLETAAARPEPGGAARPARAHGVPGARLVPLGLAWGGAEEPLSGAQCARLAALGLSHLALELQPAAERSSAKLRAAADAAKRAGLPLALTIRITAHPEHEILSVIPELDRLGVEVASWTVLSEGQPTTLPEHARAARKLLERTRPGVPIGGGTRAFFAELNRNRPAIELLDFLAFPLNPQVHASDDLSMVETLGGQRAVVESARAIAAGRAVHVGPVTLKMQWNPNATGPVPPTPAGELPSDVDARQREPFAAAWTLGSIKALSESGASRATYYETVGWKGVMERPAGSLLPARFASRPDELFPVYHLLAELGALTGCELVAVESSEPLACEALGIRTNGSVRVFAANYEGRSRELALERAAASAVRPVGSGERVAALGAAAGAPARWRLPPHAVVSFDLTV